VRVAVHADGRVVIRDGHGTGEAHGASPAEVHDRALKSAETDATKRALATFGKAFGLALYAGAVAQRQRVIGQRHPILREMVASPINRPQTASRSLG
jgi:recombination DNA repair RAD52 pathway protein